ncbi:hypothetical protein ACWDUN_25475 [Mycobacterium sp. NPDC003323]
MEIVNAQLAIPATLTDPDGAGYLVLAAEIGKWAGPFPLPSRRRSAVLARAAALCRTLRTRADVLEVTLFRPAVRPPGEGAALLARAGVRPARHDIVVLIRTRDHDGVDRVRADPDFRALLAELGENTYQVAADNAARIAAVDHRRDDWFLFNYFHCDDADTVYDVWEYTAGWFQRHTDLPNSTLLRPLPGERTDFRIVNHASWPNLRTFLPVLLFHPEFRRFVLAIFKANGVAAQPIIYRVLR